MTDSVEGTARGDGSADGAGGDSAPPLGERSVDALLADLREARTAAADAEDAVESVGESRLESVADAHGSAVSLLDRYEDRAVGSGDFEAYLEFQNRFLGLVEELPEDLPKREAFEAASDRLDRRRLRERDFEAAREHVADAEEVADRLDERERAREREYEAERRVEDRLDAVEERIGELERLVRLGDADLDAPVERLREPVEAYNDAVKESFAAFRREASARELFAFVETTAAYPLVDYRQPPAELAEYVAERDAGTESVTDLLDYADYSTSKLDHYVDDAAALKRRVAVHRTYLERLDAEPLVVSWPPPSAGELRYRARELVAVVGRFADEETVAKARALRDLAERDDYGRLRTAAEARTTLTETERERLERGAVARELDRRREERARLAGALAESK
ncbi:hypothetical protein ACFO0N_16835 [Halobium salinum]|uniref:Uncharacterized protein n=1 Tax=Halobium salinum TaxID=1364940 RepID=A0ABD5PFQ7_9EURY|nr:hypothetical protein [Halobium salinum]